MSERNEMKKKPILWTKKKKQQQHQKHIKWEIIQNQRINILRMCCNCNSSYIYVYQIVAKANLVYWIANTISLTTSGYIFVIYLFAT